MFTEITLIEVFAAHQLTADYKRAFSASRPIAVCEHDLHRYEVRKIIRTFAVRRAV